jgi:hypothetical protein
MSILTIFITILQDWRKAFCKNQAFEWAVHCAIGLICALNRHTISNALIWLALDHINPSSAYALFARFKWDPEDLFDPILKRALENFESSFIAVAADDTQISKTGKKIPSAFWQRFALSPKFRYNLIWGLRFLQFSFLVKPQGNVFPTRALPIRFQNVPAVKCPKNASPEQKKEYKKMLAETGLSAIFMKKVRSLRDKLDAMGFAEKTLLMIVDGSFCNKACMRFALLRVELLGRCRKNIRLCFQEKADGKSRRFYHAQTFTPEDVRTDNSPWSTGEFFYGGGMRTVRYKEVRQVFWQSGTLKRPLRLIVLAPTPYFRGGRRLYRQPAYLLCTDLDMDVEKLIQAYLDRWQIEVNHKEEKSQLGVGHAQVRNEKSVSCQPALHVAAYSALLLAAMIAFKDQPLTASKDNTPYWRKQPPKRLTCRAILGLLRAELIEDPGVAIKLGLSPPNIVAILKKAA